MGSRYFNSQQLSSRLGLTATLALTMSSACNLTKKEDASQSAAASAAVVVPAAPIFTVAVPAAGTTSPGAAATPEPVAQKPVDTKGKAASGGATGKTTAAVAATGGTTSAAATTKAAAGGGTPAKATTAAALPTVDMACINGCGTKLQACLAAAGMDAAKLSACQSVVTDCQNDCKAK